MATCVVEEWFSVWAMPPPAHHPRIKQAMEMLRKRFGGPEFEPHLTVVGAQKLSLAQASDRLQNACRLLTPFHCRLTHVGCGETYFQCVYAVVEASDQVMQANLQARRFFELGPVDGVGSSSGSKDIGYMPHLSLLYGDLTDEEKQEAKEMVQNNFGPLISGTQFQVNSLCLYRTDTSDKLLKSWEKVAECQLQGKCLQ
eukprot:c18501_g1_i1 orf=85-681(+)